MVTVTLRREADEDVRLLIPLKPMRCEAWQVSVRHIGDVKSVVGMILHVTVDFYSWRMVFPVYGIRYRLWYVRHVQYRWRSLFCSQHLLCSMLASSQPALKAVNPYLLFALSDLGHGIVWCDDNWNLNIQSTNVLIWVAFVATGSIECGFRIIVELSQWLLCILYLTNNKATFLVISDCL